MLGRSRNNNRKPRWSRFVVCAALGLYLPTLVSVPMLHTHGCEHDVKVCCNGHPASGHIPAPDSDDSCLACEFAHLVIPFFMISEPLVWRTDIVDEICVTVSVPSVAHATALPPCRAPPAV